MPHIITVLIFQSIGKITTVCIVESLAYLLECFGWETWVETMNLYLEADESVLGVIFIAHRLLDGLDAGSRRCENHRMATLLGILGIEEVAVHRMTFLIYLKLYKIAIYLICTIFLGEFLGIAHRHVLQFVLCLLPESIEILRFLGIRLNLIYRESYFDMMLIGLTIEFIE